MKRNDNVFEEGNVLISKRHGETTDNAGEDVKKLGSSVELVGLMNKREKTLIDGLSNHFSSWNQFSVKFVKNIF